MVTPYTSSNAVINSGVWPEQLYFCTDKKKQKGICNCTMCPHFRAIDSPDACIALFNFCRHMGGKVREPEISWCKTGIACMWLMRAKPDDAVKLLSGICSPKLF